MRKDDQQWRMVLGLDLQLLIASVERRTEREGEGGAQAASIGSNLLERDGVGGSATWLDTWIWKGAEIDGAQAGLEGGAGMLGFSGCGARIGNRKEASCRLSASVEIQGSKGWPVELREEQD